MPIVLPDYLTGPQREAVLHTGSPLLIIAGPGSGKTEVISWRVAYLVSTGQVSPDQILALTFTRKATLELADRIQRKLPTVNADLMQISTFHSFCGELLRRYPRQSGLENGYQVLDGIGQSVFIYSRRKALGLDDFIKGLPSMFYAEVTQTFNRLTEEQVAPAALLAWYQSNQVSCVPKELSLWQEREAIARAYTVYRQLLLEEGLLDFAHMQIYALRLLEDHPEILAEIRQRTPEILVDEYQDTDVVQEHILKLLAGDGRRLTVVGDDDQSIYRFRGATVQNILDFPRHYPEARVVKLVHNFRSHDQIVDHSLQVITNNPARFAKDLQPTRGPGSEVLLVYEKLADDEVAREVSILYSLAHSGKIAHWRDVAILLRSVKSYAGPYRDHLTRSGIPYQVIGDASFFEREEIQELYALYRFLGAGKPWGDASLRQPLAGFSEATLAALKAYQDDLAQFDSASELGEIGIQDREDQERLVGLIRLKRRVQNKQHGSLLEVFYDLLAITGCAARFERAGQAEVMANLGIFSKLVAAWDDYGSTRNFYPFQEYLKLIKDSGVDPYLPPVDDAVQIMTIHQAKGLEFPVVVLGAAMNGRLPSTRRRDNYEIPPHLCASGGPEVEDPHLVDERKLFYVAATRARDLLLVGTADLVNKRGGGPSPFLSEMFGPDLHVAAQIGLEKVTQIESQAEMGSGPRPRHSFSELSMFLECPLRYEYAHVYELQAVEELPFLFGVNVHLALDRIHREALTGRIPVEEDILAIVTETWVTPPKSRAAIEDISQPAAVEYLQAYVREHQEGLRRVVRSEQPFSYELGGRLLRGKIDLIRRDGEQIEVVDFKTSPPHPEGLERDAFQLATYAIGANRSLGIHVSRLTVHFLGKRPRVVSWDWSEERERETLEKLSEIMGCIERGEYRPRRSFCPNCRPYQSICAYAREG